MIPPIYFKLITLKTLTLSSVIFQIKKKPAYWTSANTFFFPTFQFYTWLEVNTHLYVNFKAYTVLALATVICFFPCPVVLLYGRYQNYTSNSAFHQQ